MYKIALELGERFYELSKIHEIRWIASEAESLKKLIRMWKVLIVGLKKMSSDPSLDLATRTKAKELYEQLSSRKFLLILHFCKDVVDNLAVWSKGLQETDQVIFITNHRRNRITAELEKLVDKDGPMLKKFKSEVTCTGTFPGQPGHWAKTGCTEAEILTSPDVEWRGIKLPPVKDSDVMPVLDVVRTSTIDNLQDEISFYFPQSHVASSFAVFNNLEFPTNSTLLLSHGKENIKNVAKLFGHQDVTYLDQLAADWQSILEKLAGTPDFCNARKLPPKKFWFKYLNEVQFPSNVYNLLVRSLAVPSNTASIERGFSIMGQFRTKARNSLSPEAIDALMRVGWDPQYVSPLEQFPADMYTEKWRLTRKRVDDPALKLHMKRMKSGGNLYEPEEEQEEEF